MNNAPDSEMRHHLGILLEGGKPVVLRFEDKGMCEEVLSKIRQKDTLIELENEGMAVSFRTSDVRKTIVAWACKDFDIVRHL